MFEKHDLDYEVYQDLTVTASIGMSARLNLLCQQDENTKDCGVFICLYAWAVLTGIAWPHSSKRNRGARKRLENMRVCLGSTIED